MATDLQMLIPFWSFSSFGFFYFNSERGLLSGPLFEVLISQKRSLRSWRARDSRSSACALLDHFFFLHRAYPASYAGFQK